MTSQSPFYAIIVAGGQGQRSGLPLPKQYADLGGRAVLDWSVAAFARHPRCAGIVLVVPEGDGVRALAAATSAEVHLATGGATRQASVASGLAAVETLCEDSDALVLVHDAARPGLSATVIDALLSAFDDPAVDGAVPALPVADTLALDIGALGDVVPRDKLLRIQTPQAFRHARLQAAHTAWASDSASDDAQMLRADGGNVQWVPGDIRLDKITNAGDLEHMTRILTDAASTLLPATGTGFDVHRLIPGEGLWLGGVFIAHNRRLEGHSDADVLLHAITDAMLGAIADGDIGSHFPPSEAQWKGASSDRFLSYAGERVAAQGARITHIDCTVMCEAPKVGPHREAIRARIAEILNLPLARVAVKATTTERLGFTGRGEGIAAQAVVTVLRPE